MTTLTLATLIDEVADEIDRDGEETAIRRAIERTTDRANRLLRTRWMLCRASAPIAVAVSDGEEYVDLPPDFAGMIGARFIEDDGTSTELRYQRRDEAALSFSPGSTGVPCHYSLYENQIRLLPAPDRTGTLEIWTYERFGLESDTDTNWLLQNHRDIYINGATYFLKRRLQAPIDEIRDYETAFLSGIGEVKRASAFDLAGGGVGDGPDYF